MKINIEMHLTSMVRLAAFLHSCFFFRVFAFVRSDLEQERVFSISYGDRGVHHSQYDSNTVRIQLLLTASNIFVSGAAHVADTFAVLGVVFHVV